MVPEAVSCPDRLVLGCPAWLCLAIFKHSGVSARLTGACTLPWVPRRKSGGDLIQGTPIFLRSNDRFRGQNQGLNIVKFKNQHFDKGRTTQGSMGFFCNELASDRSRLSGPPPVSTATTQLCPGGKRGHRQCQGECAVFQTPWT